MSNPKAIRVARNLLQQLSKMAQSLTKGLAGWLLRGLLVIGRQPLLSKAGFVLPTTVLLLLVVILTVGAISYRTFTRTQQTIGERQQRVVYNAATPAIDRAKTKIETLFDSRLDPRSGGVPSQTQLLGMMLNDGRDLGGLTVQPNKPGGIDPYTLEGETRIDITGDGKPDNAWRYRVDLNSDGTLDGTAVYSIIFTAPGNPDVLKNGQRAALQTRATGTGTLAPLVRNAPLSNNNQSSNVCQRNTATNTTVPLINSDGWFPDQVTTTKLRKNFQVDAYVVPDNRNVTVATLEFQQDREATQGFKWAAWFRNDLEIFPGPAFNWNGAMHTEGNLIVGGNNSFRGYMISAPKSCLYAQDASTITTHDIPADASKGIPAFQGQFITGTVRDNNFNGGPRFDLWNGADQAPIQDRTMSSSNDSVRPGGASAGAQPADFALEPVKLQTQDISIARKDSVANPLVAIDPAWNGGEFGSKRMAYDRDAAAPYVDDTFRADNRFGPKPRFGRNATPIPGRIGTTITGYPDLIGNTDPTPGTDSTNVGLDGYWERRARREGLRLIVGQRLELGDPAGWGGPGATSGNPISLDTEPLRPWPGGCTGDRCNEERQRKTSWDNLAAVQGTAVYHNATDTTPAARDFPDACLVSTIHPGTPGTLDKSATFENLAFRLPTTAIPGYTDQANPLIISDFFRGRGTNGWEYSVPKEADFRNINSPLMKAMRNLATFAGDPKGGAPSFTPDQTNASAVHPYPSMAMWGDFSMLRRVMDLLSTSGTGYDALSPADKTTLHTAGCTLGMLAYNIDYLEQFNYDALDAAAANSPAKDLIGYKKSELDFAQSNTLLVPTNASSNFYKGLRGYIRRIDYRDLVPTALKPPAAIAAIADQQMQQMVWDAGQSNNPETYVRLLERWRDSLAGDLSDPNSEKSKLAQAINLAQLIITKEQVGRDRQTGFTGKIVGDDVTDTYYTRAPLGRCAIWSGIPPAVPSPELPIDPANVLKTPAEPLFHLCSTRPRYPILYSLFPAGSTGQPATVDAGYTGVGTPAGFLNHGDLSVDREILIVRDSQDSSGDPLNYIRDANDGLTYTVVRPSLVATYPNPWEEWGGDQAQFLPAGSLLQILGYCLMKPLGAVLPRIAIKLIRIL